MLLSPTSTQYLVGTPRDFLGGYQNTNAHKTARI